MGVPICPKAVGNAHTPISHAHIRIHVMDARRLMLVYLLNFLHSGTPINRKREIQYVMSFSNDAAKVQLIFHMCK